MKSIVSTLLIILLLSIGCDSESIAAGFNSENPPQVSLVILNQSELAEKSVGDSVVLELALEVSSMPQIKSLSFNIGYNINADNNDTSKYFSASNLIEDTNVVDPSSYQFTPNFFSLADETIASPIGLIIADEDSSIFKANLGIPNADINGNKWGSGTICVLYLEGIYTESLISLEILEALEYTDEDTDANSFPHWNSWIVTENVQVGSAYNPTLKLALVEQTSDEVVVLLQIENSPKLLEFSSLLSYNSDVLNVIPPFIPGTFFNENYDFQVIAPVPESSTGYVGVVVDPSGIDDYSNFLMSSGSGDIFEFHFSILDTSISGTSSSIDILTDSLLVRGYNLNDSTAYNYNTLFWNIEESLLIDF